MGKKLNGLFKATSQTKIKLELRAKYSCLMFLSLLMPFSDARLILESRSKEHNSCLGVLPWWLKTLSLKFRVWNETCFTSNKKWNCNLCFCYLGKQYHLNVLCVLDWRAKIIDSLMKSTTCSHVSTMEHYSL